MGMNDGVYRNLRMLLNMVSEERLDEDISFKDICEEVHVARMYYDMDLGDSNKYRDPRTGKYVIGLNEKDNKILLYDSGAETDLKFVYPYYFAGAEYVHAYIEFYKGIRQEDIDPDLYQFLADVVYIIVSHRNMRIMLNYAEINDSMTGIPNAVACHREYDKVVQTIPPDQLYVLHIDIKNLKNINEEAGDKCGDEVIIKYAHELMKLIGEDEGVCRIGSDNYAMFIKASNFDRISERLSDIVLSDFESAIGRNYKTEAWIGVSKLDKGGRNTFISRLNDAAVACDVAKRKYKKNIVFYNDELARIINEGRDIIEMFMPAMRNNEFIPYFQPKVDMNTGKLIGFEALCRWKHNGEMIYPDQFIPTLDREGLIPELDITIFNATCQCIRKWKDMGLNPPRVSCNFSKKDMFVSDIENRILKVIKDNNIRTDDLEIEITESVKESEHDRLIEFIKNLKGAGLYISIDDFGTGYSSLSLIHSIDADVIKIDKSFVDTLPADGKSKILIESIISIASKLDMSIIAEGVETAEQGQCLLEMGCNLVQGYFYSKPVSFSDATRIIETNPYKKVL
ncbi:MAG: bifunctional diguanylate cyclase/phosphodiesterase [Lachnospiraceae bacterium]|nr:bifunctional diguanylate cyclase/phosphodiesterase [Lachnospiraceae bacterium]